MNALKIILFSVLSLSLMSTATAIDINSSHSMQYYSGGNLNLEATTSGDLRIPHGSLKINPGTSGKFNSIIFQESGKSNYFSILHNQVGNKLEIQDMNDGEDIIRFNRINNGIEIPNGDLKLNGNAIKQVGELNITNSTSGTRIADFTETGINMYQPLSIQSSGPLSVANGVQLTGTSTNTIESYSTMYLTTSSGSPTDIVLNPTGTVGIDSNLEMNGNNINSAGSVTVQDSFQLPVGSDAY